MFKTCSDPDFNWVHCLCDSATWVVKEPGKPIGFFYSRLFDDALSPSGLGFAVDAFRIDDTDDVALDILHVIILDTFINQANICSGIIMQKRHVAFAV